MSDQITIYSAPEQLVLGELKHWIEDKEMPTVEADEEIQRLYLDTFDWRLYRSGMALEISNGRHGRQLSWRRLNSGEVLAHTLIRKMPHTADDLVAPGLRRQLKQVLGERALMPQVAVNSETQTLSLRDDSEKTLLRIELRNDRVLVPRSTRHYTLAPYVCLFPYRGYEKVFDRVRRLLTGKGRLERIGEDPLVTAAACLGMQPCDYNNKPSAVLSGDQTAIDALKTILVELKGIMEKNIAGSCKDEDPEFLHDFLLGVRRTRCMLDQYGNVFPMQELSLVRQDFAWIEDITREMRNLDIHLGLFDNFKSRVDEEHKPALEPLHRFILEQKKKAHKAMRTPLESPRYGRLMKRWENFLSGDPGTQELGPDAERPIREIAGGVMWHLYEAIVDTGSRLSSDSSAGELISLQKLGKKFGYQMELFRSLYAKEALHSPQAPYRELQKTLDAFHDLHLQSETLRQYRERMQQEHRTMPTWIEAIDMLVADLEKQERKTLARFPARFRKFSGKKSARAFSTLFLGDQSGKKAKK